MDDHRKRDRSRTAVIAAIFIIMGLVFVNMLIGDPFDGGTHVDRGN